MAGQEDDEYLGRARPHGLVTVLVISRLPAPTVELLDDDRAGRGMSYARLLLWARFDKKTRFAGVSNWGSGGREWVHTQWVHPTLALPIKGQEYGRVPTIFLPGAHVLDLPELPPVSVDHGGIWFGKHMHQDLPAMQIANGLGYR